MRPLRFTWLDAQRAGEAWRFNCGPAAIAALCGLTPDEIRPRLFEFERQGYMTPNLAIRVLEQLGATSTVRTFLRAQWPRFGLARVQWHGPWMRDDVPPRARYRYTHWVAVSTVTQQFRVFDVNALETGGWLDYNAWSEQVVPEILASSPQLRRATGKWSLTTTIQVVPASVGFDAATRRAL